MWCFTCIPINVYNALFKFKPLFRCVQAQHFWVFCWVLIALILDNGKGTLKDLCQHLPRTLKYWTLMRMVRSGQWDEDALVTRMASDVLRWLPPPADGVLHLSGDKTRKEKRGRKHPLGSVSRESEHAPYTFGFDMVILIASWQHFRFPVAIAPIDPAIKGHQNIVFRQMLATFEPPAWVRQVIVSADAGFAANKTLQLIQDQQWVYVFAMPRTRKFTNGKHVRDLVCHLPKSCYRRRASSTPDGRRRDYWVFVRHATLNHLGDVTIVLSKKRRNDGPKQVKLFVTNLTEARAGAILSEYAWPWGVELTIKELKSGLRLGQMQVTNDAARVARSVALPVCAYLLLVRLYGHDAAVRKPWSLFQLKQRFTADMVQQQVHRTEQKWLRKFKQYKRVA
jgi:Transposase DDE domain